MLLRTISMMVVVLSLFAQGPIERTRRPAPQDAAMPSSTLRVDTNLVLVPVAVNDELNHPVTGLERENFRVFDDKVEQAITAFSTEDEPIALGFIFDTSSSMQPVMGAGRQA